MRSRVEDEAGSGCAARPAPPRRGDAAHGETAVRVRDDTLRPGRRRVQSELSAAQGQALQVYQLPQRRSPGRCRAH